MRPQDKNVWRKTLRRERHRARIARRHVRPVVSTPPKPKDPAPMNECANCGQPCDGDFCDHTCFSAWWDYQTDLAQYDHDLHWTEVA